PGAWRQLYFAEDERPVCAQIYGSEPERFYQAAQVLCALGFDGVDINMGCPAKSVARRGCGAGLIANPPLARAIIRAVQAGVQDWASGHRLETLGLRPVVLDWIQRRTRSGLTPRRLLPVSVKTRVGYDTVVVEAWIAALLMEQPAAIALHGRTLAQKYQGQADWEAIRRAATLVRETSTLVLGNGDIRTMQEAVARVRQTQVHGVLIGRGALGNPWLFQAKSWARQLAAMPDAAELLPAVSQHERLQVALEHARYFEALGEGAYFPTMRKHLSWYCRGFPSAVEVRSRLVTSNSAAEVAHILAPWLTPEAMTGSYAPARPPAWTSAPQERDNGKTPAEDDSTLLAPLRHN
ncbi:MAG: tRNA-dihydrouridine synthase, partial [Candidatus Tectomicrobia bacterium]|nr:tRNA-dihydrouridine synthase [Candidatus Tectomicrobia bacterium]